MIEFAKHIEILLLSNDCVIVPGLGGFVSHYVEARYEPDEKLFLPPLRTIGFNPQLKLNDSLLVLSYTETYDISYPEALRRIEGEVHELRQHLETEGGYELNGIGQLMLNAEGNIVFEPCEAGILTPSLYGLGSFSMPMLESEHEDTPIVDKESTSEAITIRMSWIRNAVAMVAAILTFFLITPPVANTIGNEGRVNKMEFSILPKVGHAETKTVAAEKESTKPAAEPQDTMQESAQQAVSTETKKPENLITEDKTPQQAYTIVLASQVSRTNAEDFIARLKKAGYPQARIWERNNIRRVVYGAYETEDLALSELRSVRGNKFFEEAWVIKVKE